MSEQAQSTEYLSLQKVSMPDNCAIFAPHAGFTMPPEYLSKLSVYFAEDSIALFDQTDWATAIATYGVKNTVPSPGHRFAGDPNRDPKAHDTTFIMEQSFGGHSIWQMYPSRTEVTQQRANRERYHEQCCELVSEGYS